MGRLFGSIGVAVVLTCALAAPTANAVARAPEPAPPLVLDHAWIAVKPGAPERKALVRAGFRLNPMVNRHDGQGTASVSVEFENGFLELLWPTTASRSRPS